MKNTFKFFGIIVIAAVIGFSMTACGDSGGGGDTTGSLIITGLTGYNGKYVFAFGGNNDLDFAAVASISNQGDMTGGIIASEKVTLKVWKFDYDEYTFGNFSHSGLMAGTLMVVSSKAILTVSDIEDFLSIDPYVNPPGWLLRVSDRDITFTNGICTYDIGY